MKKLSSLLYLLAYILCFIGCEWQVQNAHNNLELSVAATVTLRSIEWITGSGAIIETLEIVFEVEIKKKIRKSFDQLWRTSKPKQLVKSKVRSNKLSSTNPISEVAK